LPGAEIAQPDRLLNFEETAVPTEVVRLHMLQIDEERKDSLAGGVVLRSVLPARLEVDAIDREVSLQGSGFTDDMAALVGEEEREVRRVDSTEARLELSDNDVAVARSLTVRVVAGGKMSGARTIEVLEPVAE
jgi:hypothetical protein